MVNYQELQKHRMTYDERTRNEYPTIRRVVRESTERIFDIFSDRAFARFELEIIDEIEQHEKLSEEQKQEIIAKIKEIVSQFNQKSL